MTFVIIPTLLAGAGVLISGLGGLYWLPIATLAALLGSLLQAWVLLIEVLRLRAAAGFPRPPWRATVQAGMSL
jgi:hypothetical protein